MKIYFKINQISTVQYIVPTRFELYDENILRLDWKLRFLVPSKITTMALTNLLTKFARYAVATDSILINIGVKQISETICAPSLLPTDLEQLGCEFNMIGISVLDDETLKIPDGQFENPPNVKLAWTILHQFYWTNWDIKKEKLKYQLSNSSSLSEESTMESVDGTKLGYDTCGNFSFH